MWRAPGLLRERFTFFSPTAFLQGLGSGGDALVPQMYKSKPFRLVTQINSQPARAAPYAGSIDFTKADDLGVLGKKELVDR